jgi:hypothetical protein
MRSNNDSKITFALLDNGHERTDDNSTNIVREVQ